MKKLVLTLVVLLAAGALRAEEGKSWKAWYNDMLRGLKTKISKGVQSKHRVSAVAAVRGAEKGEGDPFALYWKDAVSDKAQKKLADEQKQLTAAVELVVGGDIAGGRAALEKFLKDNPESFFAQDARDALANLPAAEANTESGGAQGEKPSESKAVAGAKAD